MSRMLAQPFEKPGGCASSAEAIPEKGVSVPRKTAWKQGGDYPGSSALSPTATPCSSKKPLLTSRAYWAGSDET
ncbi:MAG: hypothetical protein K0S10_1260 [Rubrobacteraceae bacterium]|nr:hypothetical protein [Rubrobacteraceae bacterium]